MNATPFSSRSSPAALLASIAAVLDSSDALAEDMPCDIALLVGPGMDPSFGAALHEAQREHGGKVLVLETGAQDLDKLRERFHASLKPESRTELFLTFHGDVINGVHHVLVNDKAYPTLDFIELLRTPPDDDGDFWTGRVTLSACLGVHAAMDAEPGTARWQAGECIAIGGKGITAQCDGVQVYRDMFSRILQGRGSEQAPCTTVLLAGAASVSGAGVAAFGGMRAEPLMLGASESVALMHELYWPGEARRREALAAFEERSPRSDTDADAQTESIHVKQAIDNIAREHPDRIRYKLGARLTRLLIAQRLDKASVLIAEYPELLFGELYPGIASDAWFAQFALQREWIDAQWKMAKTALLDRVIDAKRRDVAFAGSTALGLLCQCQQKFTDAEIAGLARALAGTKTVHEKLFTLVCRSQATVSAVRAELGAAGFRQLAQKFLFTACEKQRPDAFAWLMQDGVNSEVVDDQGRGLWQVAILHQAETMFPVLEEASLWVDLPDRNGVTPLHDACRMGYLPGIRVLLNNEARLNTCDKNGWTPLHHATLLKKHEAVSMLLQAGADSKIKDKVGKTAAEYAW